MESHKKILGVIYIVSAMLQGLLMLAFSFIFTLILGFVLGDADPADAAVIGFILKVLDYIPAFIIIVLVLPSLIAGIGLLARQDWALTMAMIVGCLKLFSFPVGTAIGVYALWVYFEDRKISKISPSNP
jgi:hypothetical protein